MVFPFASLPCDLCRCIVAEWICEARTFSDLDTAFCNHELRPQFLSWIDRLIIPSPETSKTINNVAFNWVSFMDWLKNRNLFLSSVNIHHPHMHQVAVNGDRALQHVQSCIIDSGYLLEDDDLVTVRALSSLQSLWLWIFHADDMTLDLPPWKALPHPELVVSLQISCISGWPFDSFEQLDLPSLTALHVSYEHLPAAQIVHVAAKLSNLRTLYVDGGYFSDDSEEGERRWSQFPLLSHITKLTLNSVYQTANLLLLDRCPNVTDLEIQISNETASFHINKQVFTVYLPKIASKLHRFKYQDLQCGISFEAVQADGFFVYPYQEDINQLKETMQSITKPAEVVAPLLYSLQSTPMQRLTILVGSDYGFLGAIYPRDVETHLSQMRYLTHASLERLRCPASAQTLQQLFSLPQLQSLILNDLYFVDDAFTQCLQLFVDQGASAVNVSSFVFKQYKWDKLDMYCARQLLPLVFHNVKKMELSFKHFPKEDLLHILKHLPHLQVFQVHENKEPACFLSTMTTSDWERVRTGSRCRRWELRIVQINWPGIQRMIDGLGISLSVAMDKFVLGSAWTEAVSSCEDMSLYLRWRRLRLMSSFTPIN